MRVHAEGEIGVDTLAGRFGVTAQQIRRDLAVLCNQGMAMRTHGGVRRPVSVANIEYNARRNLSMHAKQAIGNAAAGLIEDNTAVAINIGTTTEAVANALFNHDNLMVLTNNLNIVQLMARPRQAACPCRRHGARAGRCRGRRRGGGIHRAVQGRLCGDRRLGAG